jgi:hypothetical protein
MAPAMVGSALAILGAIGLTLQLFLYPRIHQRFGTVKCFRLFTLIFPIAYFLAPYISLVPSSSSPLIWFSISFVLFLQVLARTFALPATIVLINNCSPHPSVLGTIHGAGQAVSAASRSLGPMLSGYWNGIGLRFGMVGLAWWAVSGVALFGFLTSFWVYEGSGHDTLLDEHGEK